MIKDIPKNERPRERCIKYGVSNLSNEELLSIILKSGTRNCSVKVLSERILSNLKDISELKDYTINKSQFEGNISKNDILNVLHL